MPYFEFVGEDKESEAVKEFASKEEAEKELEKLIKSKTKKGYVEKPNPH
jgi:predicted DNA-binding WGR domain protein